MHRRRARSVMIETLENRMLLSGTLSTIAAFSGANGFSPAAVVEDANRNIFGVTLFVDTGASTDQSGEVFEVAAGTNTIKVVSQFDTSGGIVSPTTLVIDSSGNLFGTANTPNASGYVFEIPAGGSTPTTLASFPSVQNATTIGSQGKLTAVDSAGNLFGIDSFGNAIEVVKNSGTISTLATFFGTSAGPLLDLQRGPDGNLYGETHANTPNIVKIVPSTGVVTTLATMDSSTVGNTPQGITLDSAGDVWGFNQSGSTGPNLGGGTVWELPTGQSTISLVSNFTAATGYNPICRPVFGTDGNLYGMTENGGANGNGSLFDVPAGSSTTTPGAVTDLQDFTFAEQAPDAGCGIITNSSGVASGVQSGQHDIPFFGALFTSVSASAATNELHPDTAGGFGSLLDFLGGPIHTKDDEEFLKRRRAKEQDTLNRLIRAINTGQPTPPDLQNQNLRAQLQVKLDPQKLTAKQLAPINQKIAIARRDYTTDGVQLNKGVSLTNQYNREAKTVASLQAQLAKAKSKTVIQQRLTAAQSLQAKFLSQSNSAYAASSATMDSFDAEISTIVTEYNALLG